MQAGAPPAGLRSHANPAHGNFRRTLFHVEQCKQAHHERAFRATPIPYKQLQAGPAQEPDDEDADDLLQEAVEVAFPERPDGEIVEEGHLPAHSPAVRIIK